jgi:hypothetical protein
MVHDYLYYVHDAHFFLLGVWDLANVGREYLPEQFTNKRIEYQDSLISLLLNNTSHMSSQWVAGKVKPIKCANDKGLCFVLGVLRTLILCPSIVIKYSHDRELTLVNLIV